MHHLTHLGLLLSLIRTTNIIIAKHDKISHQAHPGKENRHLWKGRPPHDQLALLLLLHRHATGLLHIIHPAMVYGRSHLRHAPHSR